jgi:group I intron endonuclease
MAGTIYLVTNNLNGKQYVGQTIVASEKRGHGTLVTAAYRKYGKENFNYDVICGGIDNRPTLNFIEKFWIKVMDCRVPNGYNIDHGGSSKDKVSDETREKIRIANTGKKQTPEQIAKVVKALKNRSPKVKQKAGDKLRGRKRPQEVVEKVRQGNLGKKVSDETKAKLSAINKGKIVSEETRLKLSLAAKNQWAKIKGEL